MTISWSEKGCRPGPISELIKGKADGPGGGGGEGDSVPDVDVCMRIRARIIVTLRTSSEDFLEQGTGTASPIACIVIRLIKPL